MRRETGKSERDGCGLIVCTIHTSVANSRRPLQRFEIHNTRNFKPFTNEHHSSHKLQSNWQPANIYLYLYVRSTPYISLECAVIRSTDWSCGAIGCRSLQSPTHTQYGVLRTPYLNYESENRSISPPWQEQLPNPAIHELSYCRPCTQLCVS